jgi:nucleotide-binding universal stress UspA family protein
MNEPYRILCAIDGSAGSNTALDMVAALPLRARDRVVVGSRPGYLFQSRTHSVGPIAQHAAHARARARRDVDAAVARLAGHGIDAKGVVCEAGEDAVDAILRCVDDVRASLLVVGSRGRGPWSSILLGSTARALAIMSTVPVLVARTSRAPVRVLVASDGSQASREALAAFSAMPQSEGCLVELLGVLPVHEWPEPLKDGDAWTEMGLRTDLERDEQARGLAVLERERGTLPAGVETRIRQERGHAGLTILARASTLNADLIVVGTHGVEGRRQPFFGSTAERVLTQGIANVLVGAHTVD